MNAPRKPLVMPPAYGTTRFNNSPIFHGAPTIPQAAAIPIRRCAHCGVKHHHDATHCASCGAPL